MRVVVDTGLCRGHGVCMEEAPEVFHVARDGSIINVSGAFVPDLAAKIRGLAPARSAVQSAQSAVAHLGLQVKNPIVRNW